VSTAAHFSSPAIFVLLLCVVVGSFILLRRYPDGLNDRNGLPSFSLAFMVCSACFGATMAVFLALVMTGQITFDI